MFVHFCIEMYSICLRKRAVIKNGLILCVTRRISILSVLHNNQVHEIIDSNTYLLKKKAGGNKDKI